MTRRNLAALRPMLPLAAVVLAPAGHAPPSLDDLAGRFGVAVSLVIKSGSSVEEFRYGTDL